MRNAYLHLKNEKEHRSAPFVNMAHRDPTGIKPFNW